MSNTKHSKHSKSMHAKERSQFRALLLNNPNYFGNLDKCCQIKSSLNIQGSTVYEELGCVGFQPQFNRLEAVVYIKQPTGYSGDICSNGSPEFVRFYLSYDNGATWVDQGLTSFTASDIPEGTKGSKRLEYAVSLTVNPPKTFCVTENIILARAILSWNNVPPEDTPDFIPVWGNVHDTHIQVDPETFFLVGDFLQVLDVKLKPELLPAIDMNASIAPTKKEGVTVAELQKIYKGKDVPVHRFALTELNKLMNQPVLSASLASSENEGLLAGLDLDIAVDDLVSVLNPGDGDTRYEEMECIGYDPKTQTLVATIRVKLSSGYSGNLCTKGSREYVTFWADFDGNGSFETCLGTTSVNVHDISNVPDAGLEYAVFLPVNFDQYRQPCSQGPRLVPVRAIMSWSVAPPCNNPGYIPVWGNREETVIHIEPGYAYPPGTHVPIIQTVASMDTDDIDPVTGLASGAAALAGFTATESPFGGEVIITGHIANTTDISAGAANLKYRVEIKEHGGSWQPLSNSFMLGRDQLLNGVWSDLPKVNQSVDATNWYDYQEDLVGGPGNAQIFPVGNVLARWQTAGKTGLWDIRIKAKDPSVPGVVWYGDTVRVMLDDDTPDPLINITSGGGDCADFTIGDVINGSYSVSDSHLRHVRLLVEPAKGGSFTSPAPLPAGGTMPLSRVFSPTKTFENGNWSLDTTGMPRCGYIVRLSAWDNTIVNSGFVGRHRSAVVGLCLRDLDD